MVLYIHTYYVAMVTVTTCLNMHIHLINIQHCTYHTNHVQSVLAYFHIYTCYVWKFICDISDIHVIIHLFYRYTMSLGYMTDCHPLEVFTDNSAQLGM